VKGGVGGGGGAGRRGQRGGVRGRSGGRGRKDESPGSKGGGGGGGASGKRGTAASRDYALGFYVKNGVRNIYIRKGWCGTTGGRRRKMGLANGRGG